MNEHSSPQISSFVLRFVQEEPVKSAVPSNYRGSVLHIQTDQEYVFTRWADALDFMSKFIPEDVFSLTEAPNPSPKDGQKLK